jgi:hypothetical protein
MGMGPSAANPCGETSDTTKATALAAMMLMFMFMVLK